MLDEKCEQGPLLRRTARLARGGRKRAGFGQKPTLLSRAARGAVAQRAGEGTCQDFPEGMVIVVSRPAEQFLQPGIEHGRGVEHLEDGPEPWGRHVRVIGEPGYDTHPALPAKGDAHACPDRGLHRALQRRKIVE
jgi:hypothetical protein